MYAFIANDVNVANIGANYGITWNNRKGGWRSWVQYGNQKQAKVGTLGVDTNHEHYYEGSSTTGSSGYIENRPSNYTIRIWKRTS